jgi:hypothetical protein
MPTKKGKQQSEVPIRVTTPELWQFEFVRNDLSDPKASWDEIPLEFALRITRVAAPAIGAELSLSINDSPLARINVSYRALFEVVLPDASSETIEKELNRVISNLAAPTLYPFIRETVITTVAKAGLQRIGLPIVNFQRLFQEMELPAYNSEATENEAAESE